MPDQGHMAFGSFPSMIKDNEEFKPVLDAIKHISQFLGHRAMRKRYVALCLPLGGRKRSLMLSFSGTAADFDWETMGEFLTNLLSILELLFETFDAEKIRKGIQGDVKLAGIVEVEADLIRKCDEALKFEM